jgi:cytochrome c nitrite reductase small subunit
MAVILNRKQRMILIAAATVGILSGLGGYTFLYAEGLSYFSADPVACVNCHIMTPQYDSWQKGSHHGVAACMDCHLPIDFAEKYLAKASNGYHHSKGFTFQDFHEPILIKASNSQLLQENCLRCHGDIVSEMLTGATSDADAVRCVKCHADVGHGEPAGLGGPMTRVELSEMTPRKEP